MTEKQVQSEKHAYEDMSRIIGQIVYLLFDPFAYTSTHNGNLLHLEKSKFL